MQRPACVHQFHTFSAKDQSTVAQQAERTVDKHPLISKCISLGSYGQKPCFLFHATIFIHLKSLSAAHL